MLFPEEQITSPRDYYGDIFCSLRSFTILWVSGHSLHHMPNHRFPGKTKQKHTNKTRKQENKALKCWTCIKAGGEQKFVYRFLPESHSEGAERQMHMYTKQLVWDLHNCQSHERLKKKKQENF